MSSDRLMGFRVEHTVDHAMPATANTHIPIPPSNHSSLAHTDIHTHTTLTPWVGQKEGEAWEPTGKSSVLVCMPD